MENKIFGNRKLYEAQKEYRNCVNAIALAGKTERRSAAVDAMWVQINKIMALGFSCPRYSQDIHEAEIALISGKFEGANEEYNRTIMEHEL